jgi:acyl-CoA thioesterase
VQAIKAGILEIADVLVVTKGDLPSADITLRELTDMLQLRRAAAWPVRVIKASATSGEGISTLVDIAAEHTRAAGTGRRLARRPAVQTESQALVAALAAADPFVRSLGIACRDGGAGRATVTMTVRDEHLNFMATCHGGVIFALADTAFGLASNSHNHVAAGIDAHITYQTPARAGDTLIASATEVSRSRKLAVYRVDVTRGDGQIVSSFTGTVYVTPKRHR